MEIFVVACGVVSVALGAWCGVPYIRSILNGSTQPHQFSWLVFTIMNVIVLVSQFLEGGRWSVLLSLVYTIGSAANFVLSLRFGTRDSSRFDRALFAGALLTIVAWVFTKNNALAIWLTVLIDVFATAMIILKILRAPSSEALVPWLLSTTAYVFSCLSLAKTDLGVLYVRPVYGLLSAGAVALAIYVGLARTRQNLDPTPTRLS